MSIQLIQNVSVVPKLIQGAREFVVSGLESPEEKKYSFRQAGRLVRRAVPRCLSEDAQRHLRVAGFHIDEVVCGSANEQYSTVLATERLRKAQEFELRVRRGEFAYGI